LELANAPREEAAVTFRVTDLMIEAVPEAAGRKKKPKPGKKPPRPDRDCTVCSNCSICSNCSVCSRCSLCTQTAPPSTCSNSANNDCEQCQNALDRNLTTLRQELLARVAPGKAA
jgi:hypothetical protein